MLVVSLEGGFLLSRNFSMGTHVKCTRVNEIEAKCERPRVNVKVERGSTITFTRDLPIHCFCFIYASNFTCVLTTVEIYPWGLQDGKPILLCVKKYLYKSSAVYFPFVNGLCHF